MKYKRILLKLSGEALSGSAGPIDFNSVEYVVNELKVASKLAEIGLVVGGGNIWRGAKKKEINRASADYIGMYSTILNGLALKEMLIAEGISAQVYSAVATGKMLNADSPEVYDAQLEKKNILIFTGGTGQPFLTTDTAAAIKAREINASVLIKATQVDGVYDSDPRKNARAKIYKKLGYDEAIEKRLGVMDTCAFSICREAKMPIVVYNFYKSGSLKKILQGEKIGTVVTA